ncbi:hypothetical protein PsorP6_006734 [Peronosclerospora sorghi]|uniref:Uncharacterized protein n=1 Tax=Peronosclerospora sorghi TaxID=230839 RepID=A0ACC0W4D7_9STRA|nr:hypothetical protein PsorP6_006734 [Peronosclerospora sorghi]
MLLVKPARAPAAYCRRFQARCSQILLESAATEEVDVDWEGEAKERERKCRVKETREEGGIVGVV